MGRPARSIQGGRRREGAAASSLRLSPNGNRLALSIPDSEGAQDLWVKRLDADAGPLSRLTFEGSVNRRASWSADGQSLTFISNRSGQQDVWTKRADGSGTAELVLDRDDLVPEAFYSPDGTWLVFREVSSGNRNIHGIRHGVDSVAVPLAATEFDETSPALSPDGRWLAYFSNDTGRNGTCQRQWDTLRD